MVASIPTTKPGDIDHRSAELLCAHHEQVYRQTDRLFAGLLLAQWLVCIVLSLWYSPRTWLGATSTVHLHVWMAVALGGVIAVPAATLVWLRPGAALTRHAIAVAQMLTSAMLIHLTGGRIETHFHIFGSLAFLSFYRDSRVLITASVVTALDHFLRGVWWPQSVFGTELVSNWRWLEHTAWVVFEVIFLLLVCRRSVREMKEIARRRAQLEITNANIEATIIQRTEELATAMEIRRRFPAGTGPWIIALTAAAMESDRERCLAAGMDAYLSKPLHRKAVEGKLREAGEKRAARPR